MFYKKLKSTIMKTKLSFFFAILSNLLLAQLPQDYVARYDFIGGSLDNNATFGQSGNLSGTISNTQYISDRFGRSNDALSINKNQLVGYTYTGTNNEVSVSFWWRGTGVTQGGNQRIFQIFDGAGDGMTMRIATNKTLIARFKNDNTDHQSSQAIMPIFDGNWHHIVFTIHKSNSGGYDNTVYIDGVLHQVLSQNVDSNKNQNFLRTNANFVISASGVGFDGDIDDFQLYNRTISASEVLSIYNYTAPAAYSRAYVNQNATGNNDGSSWSNAFTNLQSALKYSRYNLSEIWVAQGTYTPGVLKSHSFKVSLNNVALYGGFDGTETVLSERDIKGNVTKLSGDLNGDDTGVDYFNNTRSENSYHVVVIDNAEDLVLDGFQINDGHADGTLSNAFAGGIWVGGHSENLIIRNCELNKNLGKTGGAIRTDINANTVITFENVIFYNNVSRYGSGIYFLMENNRTANLNITNCLFYQNISDDRSTNEKGFTGSSIWARANGASSTLNTTITNCTFANNLDRGTTASSDRGTVALSRRTDNLSTHNVTINNSIFYFNDQGTSLATGISVNKGHVSMPNQVIINNSISEDNFSNHTLLTNTSDVDPLFSDASTNDFTLTSNSPAIDSGDNSKLPSSVIADLLGNNRIHNSTVDMGVYEFGAFPLSTENLLINKDFISIYPNPIKDDLFIKSDKEIQKVEIYNLLGKLVIKKEKERFNQINLSQLQTGVYLIRFYSEGNIISKKIIKH